MKKKYVFIFCILFLCLFSVTVFLLLTGRQTQSVNTSQMKTIIVDAGHGGMDAGAIAADGTYEKDYNLEIALKLEKILKLNGFNVIMTRTEDVMTCDDGLNSIRSRKVSDIHNRFSIIEINPDALFVSIHQNKFPDSAQHGTQVFYSGNNPESKLLAEAIQKNIVENVQPENKRLIKKSGTEIYLLYHAKSPAVLVECGFVSNYHDLELLKKDEYKKQLAMLISQGIIKYLNG